MKTFQTLNVARVHCQQVCTKINVTGILKANGIWKQMKIESE